MTQPEADQAVVFIDASPIKTLPLLITELVSLVAEMDWASRHVLSCRLE